MNNKLISIIVPVYNVEDFVSRCIESIICQSYSNWELILVDDGSSDNSGIICDKFSCNNPRIKVLHTYNQGRSSARNIGLALASGEWIVFVDSDDYVETDYLLCMVEANPQWECRLLVTQGFYGIHSDGSFDQIYPAANYGDIYFSAGEAQELISANRLLHRQAVWGRLFSASVIKDNGISFPKGVDKCEDAVFLHKYMLHCSQFKFISYRNYYYVTPVYCSKAHSIPKNYLQNYILAKEYSTLSLSLINHFALQNTPYASDVANMFHYPLIYIIFDKNSPKDLCIKAKSLPCEVLKYKKISNYYDIIIKIKYILLWLHLL